MSNFVKGMTKIGGRRAGARNRLSQEFLTTLLAEFEKHGAEAVRICRVERPIEFVKIVAGLMPKEIDLHQDSQLSELSDTELEEFIEYARRRIAERAREIATREGSPSTH
jgi:hypothetical protein